MTDVLTQVLDVLRIQTTLFAMRDLPSPWGVEFPQSAGAYFHVISGGEAWLQSGRASSRRSDPLPLSDALSPDRRCKP